jgi:TonB-dependent receptor
MAVAAALNAMFCPAQAQETAAVLPQITVTGQAASMDSALDMQQMADNVVSVVHSDAIGQLPDANTAEALQRVPGVSVERDQGEGRYVRVRGIGPDLNAVTINGSLVPSPEAGSRAVQLDVIPSGLIRSLEVTKTLTPDMDANSIGGTIEVKTISAFDHEGLFYALEGGISHDGNVDANSSNAAGTWTNKFMDGKLGIAVGLNSSVRRFGSDNVESGGKWDLDGDQPGLEEFQRRDYHIERKRQGGLFNIDYRPQEGEAYWLRTLYSRYDDTETRQRHNIEFADPMQAGVLGDAESSRELKHRKENETISSIVLGGEKKFDDWKVAAAFGTSMATQKSPNAIDGGASFESGETYNLGYTGTRRPRLIGDLAAVNNAADYEMDSVEMSDQTARDREHNLRLDLSHNTKVFGVDSELKFGGKISRRKKTNDSTVWDVDGNGGSLADYQGSPADYPWGSFGPTISPSAIKNYISGLDLNDYLDEEASRIDDFKMHENINSAYVQNTFNAGLWRVLVGVRYEGTKFKADGTKLEDGEFSDNKTSTSYHNWLPALHVRRDLDNDTSIRGAITHSVVRPTFEQLSPGYLIDGDEAAFGNPNLKPLKSRNLDLGIEKRLGYAGVISAYAFHKDIKNFVYNIDYAGIGDWAAFDEANTFANGKKASVKGIELNWMQSFRQILPAPWNGLLISANATFSDSSAKIDGYDDGDAVSRNITLPSSSKRTANLTFGYETGPWSLRLAANYKSKYLLEVGSITDADKDQYVDAQTQYDFSMRYNVNKRVQIVFEALNLSNEKYYVYTGRPSLNSQYESYGRTYKLSAKFAAF